MYRPFFLLTALLALSTGVPARANIIPSEDYGYRETNPLKATIGSSVLYLGYTPSRELYIPVKGRHLSRWQRDEKLRVRFYPPTSHSENSKKLVHLIAGLGGDDMGALSSYIAGLAHREGVSVIVYPNTLTTNFSVAASRRGLVGAAGEDAKDLYHAMESTQTELARLGLTFDEHMLTGYSHGALLAAFVAQLDQERSHFNFSRTLLMNPPLDLLHGVQVLDSFSRDYGFSLLRKITAGLGLKKAVGRHKRIVTTSASQSNFYSRVRITNRESRGLIGRLLMSSLPGTISASQAVLDLGIIPKGSQRKKGFRINFEGYIMRFYAALARLENRDFSEEELNAQNSLYRLKDFLATDSSTFVMHNADDFLLTEGDVAWMEEVFGERGRIYPRGGHLGNVFYKDNVMAIQGWLNDGSLN